MHSRKVQESYGKDTFLLENVQAMRCKGKIDKTREEELIAWQRLTFPFPFVITSLPWNSCSKI